MTARIVSEPEFRARLAEVLRSLPPVGSMTGPVHLGRLLVIDIARESGATLRKAERRYREADPVVLACFQEPPRVAFWYQGGKPQRYRHERVA